MKKILLLTSLLSFGFLTGYSQLPVSTTAANKNVVLEEYTGIKCTFCPDGHKRASAIKAANPGRVVLINIHTGSFAAPSAGQPDFRTSFGTALAGQTGLTGYPSGTVNRTIFSGSTTATSRANWAANSTTTLGQSSYANIALEGSIDIATRVLTVTSEVYITGTAPSSLKLNIALLQNNVAGPQTGGSTYNPTQINSNGDYIHGHMLRHLLTGQWGDTITTTASGTLISRTYTYTLPASINNVPLVLGDLEIAGFVAEGNQKIVTGANGPISFVAPPGSTLVDITSASATTSPTSYCTSTVIPKITVTNNSTTNPVDTFQVSYKLNGGAAVNLPVYTSLAASGSTTISFPSITLPVGVNKFVFDCDVNNAVKILEVVTSNNGSSNPEIITVSNTPITRAIAEGFEGFAYATVSPADVFPINPDGISAFILNTSNTSSTFPIGGFGNSNGVFRWRFNEIPAGKSSSLMYDKLSFSGNSNSVVEFDVAYAQFVSSNNDKLEVFISTDCGATWTSVFSKSGNSLKTAPANNSSQFYAASTSEWRKESINLSSYDGQSSVLLKLTATSDGGNSLYIDNLRIVDATTANIDENEVINTLNLYPNPSNGNVNIEYITANQSDLTISVVNTLGATVYTSTVAANNGTLTKNLDLSHLTKGVYMVNVASDNGIVTKKLIIQ